MNTRSGITTFIVFLSVSLLSPIWGQSNFSFINGDLLPDAPELAARGNYPVGVQTLDLINKNQINVLNAEDPNARYDRPLKVEVWYPAELAADAKELVSYEEVMGNFNSPDRPLIPFSFRGRASRGAKPLLSEGAFPLLIVSHGYTGSRYLMSYLTENLASKGYVVVALDHTESTFRDVGGFHSTLLNRSLDVLFILNEMARLGQDQQSFLSGLVNADLTGLIGYSMGGYGVLNIVGGGYSEAAVQFFSSISSGSTALAQRQAGNAEYVASMDDRIKAVVAFAPWGMNKGVWAAEGLAGIKVPAFIVGGSEDDISGYENGIKAIYEGAVNSDRYLLTYLNARHNVAPNPPPAEALQAGLHLDEYLRYADSVWDQRRINNINQHFLTAFLGLHLKNKEEYQPYLQLKVNATTGNWKGFKPRTSIGLELRHSAAAK